MNVKCPFRICLFFILFASLHRVHACTRCGQHTATWTYWTRANKNSISRHKIQLDLRCAVGCRMPFPICMSTAGMFGALSSAMLAAIYVPPLFPFPRVYITLCKFNIENAMIHMVTSIRCIVLMLVVEYSTIYNIIDSYFIAWDCSLLTQCQRKLIPWWEHLNIIIALDCTAWDFCSFFLLQNEMKSS